MTLRRNPRVEVDASKTVFEGRVFDVVQESLTLPSGLRQVLAIVDHPGAVAVAAEDERGDLVLVRQYRHAAGDWLIEVPAGRVEAGEERLFAAQRELEEETGLCAKRWEVLREFYAAPGFCSEWMTLYHARDLAPVEGGRRPHDHDEELEIVRLSPADVLRESVVDAKTLIAALLLARRRS